MEPLIDNLQASTSSIDFFPIKREHFSDTMTVIYMYPVSLIGSLPLYYVCK